MGIPIPGKDGLYIETGPRSAVTSYNFLVSDIDECEMYSLCNQTCNNTAGGYTCSCEAGYKLATDLTSCEGTYVYLYSHISVYIITYMQMIIQLNVSSQHIEA